MFPKIKKTLKSFILDEKGAISKQSILKIGSALALSTFAASSHVGAQCDPLSTGSCGCSPTAPSCAGTGSTSSCGCEGTGACACGGGASSCACGCGGCGGGCGGGSE